MKNGEKKAKRSLKLVDEGMETIEVVFWGPTAERSDQLIPNSVVIFRQVRVGIYQGITNLSYVADSSLVNRLPNEPKVEELLSFLNSSYDPSAVETPVDRSGNNKFFQNFEEVENAARNMTTDENEKQFFIKQTLHLQVFRR